MTFEELQELSKTHGDYIRETNRIKSQLKKDFLLVFDNFSKMNEKDKEELCDKIEEEIFVCSSCDPEKVAYCDDHMSLYSVIKHLSFEGN